MNSFFFTPEDRQILIDNKDEILARNHSTLCILSSLSFTLVWIMFFLSSHLEGFKELSNVYLAFALIQTVEIVTLYFFVPHHMGMVQPLGYFSLFLFHSFGIISGVFFNRDYTAGTFFAFLYIIPLLLIDRPMRIHLVTVLAVCVFCVSSYLLKTEVNHNTDIVNALCNMFISIFISTHLTNIKLREIDARRKLIYQRDTDILTGLPNRRKLFERLAQTENVSSGEKLCGVLMMDIDLFKMFNDTYGHQAGDDCLKKIGEVFLSFSKDTELEFYRYGGEEFLALSFSHSYEELEAIAKKINLFVKELNIPMSTSNHKVVTVSIGFSHVSTCEPLGYRKFISDADFALYYAKYSGRNTFCANNKVPKNFALSNTLGSSFR